jgi:hypothetical protein
VPREKKEYLLVELEVKLEGINIVLKASVPMDHIRSSPLMVFRFFFMHLSVTLQQVVAKQKCSHQDKWSGIRGRKGGTDSLVMKLMNSKTHSWMDSLAS